MKIELNEKQNEFLKFCNENYKQIESLKASGLFQHTMRGAGSARVSWNSSGQFAKPKDFNYPDLKV